MHVEPGRKIVQSLPRTLNQVRGQALIRDAP